LPDRATTRPDAAGPEIGQRLSAARLQRGLSQGTVARRAGVAATYLSRLENGRVQPTFRMVMRITTAMRLDLAELVEPSREGHQGTCPVTPQGRCLLDLIRPEEHAVPGEHYTPREVKLLRNVASWIKRVPSDRVRALEILLADLMQSAAQK